MAIIVWTRELEIWLKNIYDYIAEDNPESAVKVLNGIYERAQVLLDSPNIGYLYEQDLE